MTESSAKFEFRWKRYASAICVTFILFAVFAQAVHVHTQGEPSGTPCLACVSAHTGAPVSPVVSSVLLVTITPLVVLPELEIHSSEAVLPLFIRPPPSR